MKAYWKYLIIGAAIVVSAWLLARAYTYKYHAQETIVVTGLGETEFSSDLIVWNGFITPRRRTSKRDTRRSNPARRRCTTTSSRKESLPKPWSSSS